MSLTSLNPRHVAAIDLGRILSRLEHNILSVDAEPRLQDSSYERIKTSAVILPFLSFPFLSFPFLSFFSFELCLMEIEKKLTLAS